MSITWKYETIADWLRAEIEHGRLRPGDQVPSSRALADDKHVSRATAQLALGALVDEGLVYNRPGRGFFVTETPVARLAGSRGTGRRRIEGAMPFRILGEPGYAAPPERVRVALGLAVGVRALARTRMMTTPTGEPVSVVTAWFPPDIAAAAELLHQSAPLPGGTTRHIAERTGLRPVTGEDVSVPRLATEDEARMLGVAMPAAVEDLLHTAADATGKALVCEEGVTRAEYAERVDNYSMA